MDDLRKEKSKKILKKAFWELLENKPYDRISITDVAAGSGLNRKTFYSNYTDVDELCRDCLWDFLYELLLPFDHFTPSGEYDFAYSTREYTKFALENRHTFQLIFQNRLDGMALQVWQAINLSKSASFPEPVSPYTDKLRQDLYLNYTIYSCWGNLLWVLENDTLPLDELVSQALEVYQTYLSTYFKLYKDPQKNPQ
jgi:AcrR family transcriptional regulator